MNTKEQIEKIEKYMEVAGEDALICGGLLAVDVLEKLQDNEMLHKLLDMRDDRYFRWCERGTINDLALPAIFMSEKRARGVLKKLWDDLYPKST